MPVYFYEASSCVSMLLFAEGQSTASIGDSTNLGSQIFMLLSSCVQIYAE